MFTSLSKILNRARSQTANQENHSQPLTLANLNPDILAYILLWVHYTELPKLKQVNKQFSDIIDAYDDMLWKRWFLMLSNHQELTLDTYDKQTWQSRVKAKHQERIAILNKNNQKDEDTAYTSQENLFILDNAKIPNFLLPPSTSKTKSIWEKYQELLTITPPSNAFCDEYGYTPAVWAEAFNNPEFFKQYPLNEHLNKYYLGNYGLIRDALTKAPAYYYRQHHDNVPEVYKVLFTAIVHGHYEIVNFILNKLPKNTAGNPELENPVEPFANISALLLAAQYHNSSHKKNSIFNLLLAHGANICAQPSQPTGLTVLHYATLSGNRDFFAEVEKNYLATRKVTLFPQDIGSILAFMFYYGDINRDYTALTQYLFDKLSKEQIATLRTVYFILDNTQKPLLFYAARLSSLLIFNLLVDYGFTIPAPFSEDNNLLYEALCGGQKAFCEWLTTQNVTPELTNPNNQKQIMLAWIHNVLKQPSNIGNFRPTLIANEEFADYLLQTIADPQSIRNIIDGISNNGGQNQHHPYTDPRHQALVTLLTDKIWQHRRLVHIFGDKNADMLNVSLVVTVVLISWPLLFVLDDTLLEQQDSSSLFKIAIASWLSAMLGGGYLLALSIPLEKYQTVANIIVDACKKIISTIKLPVRTNQNNSQDFSSATPTTFFGKQQSTNNNTVNVKQAQTKISPPFNKIPAKFFLSDTNLLRQRHSQRMALATILKSDQQQQADIAITLDSDNFSIAITLFNHHSATDVLQLLAEHANGNYTVKSLESADVTEEIIHISLQYTNSTTFHEDAESLEQHRDIFTLTNISEQTEVSKYSSF
ncbi:MAG: hypothetical protein Tsb005_16530 [Gammaproteobacteria bacterium]